MDEGYSDFKEQISYGYISDDELYDLWPEEPPQASDPQIVVPHTWTCITIL